MTTSDEKQPLEIIDTTRKYEIHTAFEYNSKFPKGATLFHAGKPTYGKWHGILLHRKTTFKEHQKEQFTFEFVADGYYKIHNLNTAGVIVAGKKVRKPTFNEVKKGTFVDSYVVLNNPDKEFSHSGQELWLPIKHSDGSFQFINKFHGKPMVVADHKYKHGTYKEILVYADANLESSATFFNLQDTVPIALRCQQVDNMDSPACQTYCLAHSGECDAPMRAYCTTKTDTGEFKHPESVCACYQDPTATYGLSGKCTTSGYMSARHTEQEKRPVSLGTVNICAQSGVGRDGSCNMNLVPLDSDFKISTASQSASANSTDTPTSAKTTGKPSGKAKPWSDTQKIKLGIGAVAVCVILLALIMLSSDKTPKSNQPTPIP